MSIDKARHFADQAALSIQGGQAGLGLELAEQALRLDPDMGDAENLRGVALSLSGQPRQAEEALLHAGKMLPGLGKPFYNLAVHYYGLGRRQEALDWAARALVREPNHAQAFTLQSVILDQSTNLKPNLDLPFEYQGKVAATTKRVDSSGIGLAGWTLSGLSLLSVVMAFRETLGNSDSISAYVACAFLASYIGGIAFLGIDAARTKRSFAWAAAYGFVGCIAGWLVIPTYMLLGLKRTAEAERPKSS